MQRLNLPRNRPAVKAGFLLKCPYCLQSALLKSRSWFEFQTGCPRCGYRYNREPGYFWGAPWMINYPLTGLFTLLVLYWLYRLELGLPAVAIATLTSFAAVSFGLLLYPFARAFWLIGDHFLHPLTEDDRLQSDES